MSHQACDEAYFTQNGRPLSVSCCLSYLFPLFYHTFHQKCPNYSKLTQMSPFLVLKGPPPGPLVYFWPQMTLNDPPGPRRFPFVISKLVLTNKGPLSHFDFSCNSEVTTINPNVIKPPGPQSSHLATHVLHMLDYSSITQGQLMLYSRVDKRTQVWVEVGTLCTPITH